MRATRYNFDPATTGTFWFKGQDWPIIQGAQDPPAGDPPSGDGTPPGTGDGTPPADGDKDKQDEKVFTQEQLNAIVTRETQKAARGKLDPKELGFESGKELKDFLDQMKAKAEADKTDDEKAREEAIEAAKNEARDSVLSEANKRIVKAEFLLAARDHDVPREAAADAFLLAQTLEPWNTIAVDEDGVVTGFDEDFFKQLKEAKPYLFAAASSGDGSDNGRQSIGAGNRGGAAETEADKKARLKTLFPSLPG